MVEAALRSVLLVSVQAYWTVLLLVALIVAAPILAIYALFGEPRLEADGRSWGSPSKTIAPLPRRRSAVRPLSRL
jgi:hypothetical protein